MTKTYKNLAEQLQGYTENIQSKLTEHQAVLLQERARNAPDATTLSNAMGAIYAIAMYETYLDIICDTYGFIDREFMAREYDHEMTPKEFDEWVEEQQEWFTESANLPAEPSTFPCLINWLDDFFTTELLLPDSTLNLQVREKAAEEFADYDEGALRDGMMKHLQWLREALVPALMPRSWTEDDTPDIYKKLALSSLKRQLN